MLRGREVDRNFTLCLSAVCAIGAWLAVVTLLVVATATGQVIVAAWGLAGSAVAATINIKAYFVRQESVMRNAFELGRDAGVRRMR